MTKIAVAGFQHESNSSGFGRAGMKEFEMADSWPELLKGQAVLEQTKGMNLPIAGFAEAANKAGMDLAPVLWCAAEPSGPVTDDAFDTIAGQIIQGLHSVGKLDGIYLDLHGAMITDSCDDGEGELLRRIRSAFGSEVPLIVSYDLHANVSDDMVNLPDAVTVYRTYPHLDMAETGMRAHSKLLKILSGTHYCRHVERLLYLIPLHAQYTGSDPVGTVYDRLRQMETAESYAEFAMGFTAGDTEFTGPAMIVHAATKEEAMDTAEKLLPDDFKQGSWLERSLPDPKEAVAKAIENKTGKPLVLADVQDNPGAGASSDSTGILRELVSQGARKALLGLMYDPEIADVAHSVGEGCEFSGMLGGKFGHESDKPFNGQFKVEKLSDGNCKYTGEMYGGGMATLGKSASIRVVDGQSEVFVVVTSIRNQCLDLSHFTHFGLDPVNARILCVKSTVHYRADFEPISCGVISVASPGLFPCLLDKSQFKKLRNGMRL